MVLTDNFIRKTKQRYNSPRSLSTKINLADMQTEIKLRPPYQLSAEDIGSINGFSQHKQSKYKGIGREHTVNTRILAFSSKEQNILKDHEYICTPSFALQIFKSSYFDRFCAWFIPAASNQMLEAVTLSGIVACVLSVLCGALNLLRGVHAIESVLQVT